MFPFARSEFRSPSVVNPVNKSSGTDCLPVKLNCNVHFPFDHFSDDFIGKLTNLGITQSYIGDTLYRESIGLSPSIFSTNHKDQNVCGWSPLMT